MNKKEPEDIFFDFLMALHGMKKMKKKITGFYGFPDKDGKYELRLVLE